MFHPSANDIDLRMSNLNPQTSGGRFHTMRYLRTLAVLIVIFYHFGAAAQIIEERRVGDRPVTCMHSGLSNFDCGVRADWYAYTFVGSISAITSIENDEKEIQIVPEEVFHGNPPSPLTVLTSEAACLPSLAVGDRWLFFLRKEKGQPIVFDYYGNDSLPVADAREQIETFRRLKSIGDFGIVRGSVLQNYQGQAIPNATVVAHRVPGDLKFHASTDVEGRYEFQLPVGKYRFTVDPIGSFRLDYTEDRDGIDVTRGSCWVDVLTHSPHVEFGGHVRHPDGSPVPSVHVLIIGEDGSWWTSKTNELGYFNIVWLGPGEYVVGINLPGAPAWEYGGCTGGSGCHAPPASLYYPGVQDRSSALVIKLADGEKREDVDFTVPNQ